MHAIALFVLLVSGAPEPPCRDEPGLARDSGVGVELETSGRDVELVLGRVATRERDDVVSAPIAARRGDIITVLARRCGQVEPGCELVLARFRAAPTSLVDVT